MKKQGGFTLIELILVVAIIGLLATLLAPALGRSIEKAQTVACASNLRQIGVSVLAWSNDHDQRYPEIETNPTDPVYPPEDNAKGLVETLKDYGVDDQVAKCPVDIKTTKYFDKVGTSYEWRPMIDGELTVNPQIYSPRGTFTASPKRVKLATDFEGIHFGKQNKVYADGHVVAATK